MEEKKNIYIFNKVPLFTAIYISLNEIYSKVGVLFTIMR